MKWIDKKGIFLWLPVVILSLITITNFSCSSSPLESIIPTAEGKTFTLDKDIIDLNRTPGSIDFNKAEYTIVDFWFSDCPPCLEEMSQFHSLLEKAKGKFQVVSISINSYELWSSLFKEKSETFSFLKQNSDKWSHYVMRSDLDPTLKNEISGDVVQYLQDKYRTNKYPMYLVVDRSGKVVATPESAVHYLKDRI